MKKSLRVEIAGLCGQINIEREKVLSELKSNFKDFLSKREPDFVVDVVKTTPSLNIGEEIFLDPEEGGLVSTKIIREGNKFFVMVEINPKALVSPPVRAGFTPHQKDKEIGAGFIDLDSNRCQLNDQSEVLTQLLIVPFFRASLQFFLGKSKGFLFHSCGVVKDGSAYVFAGHSGSGKTTVAGFSKGLTVLSDDFVCVRERRNSYYAYGTPWHGNDINKSAKIKKIFFLRKDKRTFFKKMKPARATSEILSNIFTNIFAKEVLGNTLNTATEVATKVPCYWMHFSLDEPIWENIDKLG